MRDREDDDDEFERDNFKAARESAAELPLSTDCDVPIVESDCVY
jgi:hypothetical protein